MTEHILNNSKISFNTISDVQLEIKSLNIESEELHLNLCNINLIDSSGIGFLFKLHKEFQQLGKQLVLIHVNDQVLNTLEFTRMDRVLCIQK